MSRDEDPLQYWKKNQAKFPNLIILVKKYLCIQASSTEAERSFSALANLLTKRRLRMSGENVNKQLFLREAIKKTVYFEVIVLKGVWVFSLIMWHVTWVWVY